MPLKTVSIQVYHEIYRAISAAAVENLAMVNFTEMQEFKDLLNRPVCLFKVVSFHKVVKRNILNRLLYMAVK